MPSVESLKLEQFAETATDYAHDNKLHLHSQLLQPGLNGIPNSPIRPLSDFVQGIPTKDRVLLHDFKMGTVLQPDKREGFTPTADAFKIKPRWAQVVECKINLLFSEKQIVALQKTFFGMLSGGGPQSKLFLERFPTFESFFMSKVVEKAKSELRNISLWKGSRNEAIQSPQAIFDGWLKLIDQAIVADLIPEANMAAINPITTSNGMAEHKKIVNLLPDEYKYSGEIIALEGGNHLTAYNENYQTVRGTTPLNNAFNQQSIEGTNIPFFVEPGLTGSETPIFTTRNNFVLLYDDDFESMTVTVDYNKRDENLALIVKFQAQPEIIDFAEIWLGSVE
ncbi:hypothetical protein [Flectobacillus roseus]|uniref:hypothetical protein n=1 Tax=Flectobacillus roseus TaxID=502259 RepID=UPI0024B7A6C0|nr:hypothetical protein [Flectobacillus roseus]MDI9871315.1 hypothetical protein [Flectobacillus roseus]MDI9872118.1 hypothetical protein [Flectobacillus roseus]